MKTSKSLIIILALCFASCNTTSRTVISDSADLSKYKYATIGEEVNYEGSAAIMNVEVEIYNIMDKTRLKMIGEKRIDELTPQQKEQLLLVRYYATQDKDESIVSVNFVDYMSGRPLASCRGAYGLGLTEDSDMEKAISRVSKEIQKLFK